MGFGLNLLIAFMAQITSLAPIMWKLHARCPACQGPWCCPGERTLKIKEAQTDKEEDLSTCGDVVSPMTSWH